MVVEASIASTVAASANATVRISKLVYELKAVGEATQNLLDSTNHISSTLGTVRTLRRQKSQRLTPMEKTWIDNVCEDTEKCLRNVAALVEPARVDLQTGSGRIGVVNRSLWVFRDSPKVVSNLARLGLTNSSLNTAMTVLCSKDAPIVNKITVDATIVNSGSDPKKSKLSPPTYHESEFLNRRRNARLSSRVSLDSTTMTGRPSSLRSTTSSFSLSPPMDSEPAWADDLIAKFQGLDTQSKEPSMPTINVEVTSTTFTPVECSGQSTMNPYEGSDGLQVVENWSAGSSPPPSSMLDFQTPPAGADGLQIVQNDYEGLQVVEYQAYSPTTSFSSARAPVHNTNQQNQQRPSPFHQGQKQWRSSEQFPTSLFAPSNPTLPTPFYHQDRHGLGIVVPAPPSRPLPYSLLGQDMVADEPHYSIPLVANVACRAQANTVPIPASKEKHIGDGSSMSIGVSRVKSTRGKSRGRTWLESQAEL